jgi:hypothetical protein
LKTLKISDETHKLLTMVKGEILAKSGDANLTYDDAIHNLIRQWNEENERRGASPALRAYHFVRFRWWERLDLEAAAEELGETYTIEWSIGPSTETDMHLRKEERNILKVKADTLGAYLDVYKAVMYQREPTPFTQRDAELRERLFEMYNRDRPTPFPWQYLEEPKYVVLE